MFDKESKKLNNRTGSGRRRTPRFRFRRRINADVPQLRRRRQAGVVEREQQKRDINDLFQSLGDLS
jgi:hypothetical protein